MSEAQETSGTATTKKVASNYQKYVQTYFDTIFKNADSEYERREAVYILIAGVLIALNTGFVNAVSMSPYFLEGSESVGDSETKLNPASQGISGTGGSFTKSATTLVEQDWPAYSYATCLVLAYIAGSFIPGFIAPRAHVYILEPLYGPTFFIAGIFILISSLFATYGIPSRFIFYFATAALGVQNSITSLYSANLIRCTLTGASTDLGLIFAECCRGNWTKFIRGTLIVVIVTCYWIGGMIAVPIVKELQERALYISAALFFLMGFVAMIYTIIELELTVAQAICGGWNYKDVVNGLFKDDDTAHTTEHFMELFDEIDVDKDNKLELEELRNGLSRSKKIKMSSFRLKAFMRAADADGDNCIERDEWETLSKFVVTNEKSA
mmetsp:Transcript_8492/g.17710  ORF Transcript_8492/g.17710 Transcript_8492/m.17710 type:complete len:382 (-) Transcript_8492:321-1466(-)|eukprot:CAMPEP_0201123958 /NCGR_PEP_ID=MMETSP0850-20130426/9597_1 /ASSEMBLY_ACC=CAM_ASM_000622 /TAXON_ID=183588 /ORGANISM="Pseudo-nitzschia fraudulenta, Strain WWA7" /LENGTH=381 /DNA_ID=CAMNT_0047391091 /DNA_START=46 /DNA_END=1191 /DNA_ORIENTATION=+